MALYNRSDLLVWSHKENKSSLFARFTFDAFWGSSDYPSLQLALPPLSREVWEQQIRDLIITQTATPFLLLPPCTDRIISPPSTLTPASLTALVPERHLALIKFTSRTTPRIIERIESAYLLSYPEGDTSCIKRAQKQRAALCIEAQLLNKLSPVERATLDYQIVPLSLQEMLIRHLSKDPTAFGKELLRVHNQLI